MPSKITKKDPTSHVKIKISKDIKLEDELQTLLTTSQKLPHIIGSQKCADLSR